MGHEDSHLSDRELMLAADGELSPRQRGRVSKHLVACWKCRKRRCQLESTIAEFVESRETVLAPQVPPDTRSRARLKAHLAETAAHTASWAGRFRGFLMEHRFRTGLAGSVLLVFAAVGVFHVSRIERPERMASSDPLEPSPRLTPGATRPVSLQEVCRVDDDSAVRTISVSTQSRVFQEYGIAKGRVRDYELDFLITPELGGANDIENLWPEAYASPVWNARVKDQLEDRLHDMVCAGKLDLATAQRDIATNWIAAYKKYFHTRSPVADPSKITLQ